MRETMPQWAEEKVLPEVFALMAQHYPEVSLDCPAIQKAARYEACFYYLTSPDIAIEDGQITISTNDFARMVEAIVYRVATIHALQFPYINQEKGNRME